MKIRKPEEIKKIRRVPISTTIKPKTNNVLRDACKVNRLSLSTLVGQVIDDYAKALKQKN